MQIRIRETGAVMYENEFRAYIRSINGPSWDASTEEIINSLGADVVFEGPQASGGTVYQYSQRSGVEQIDGKWYTKYILGPVFTNRPKQGDQPAQTAAEQEAAYRAIKDEEQAKSVRSTRNQKLAETDWRFRSDMTPTQAWKDYCIALRDVPNQSGFPHNVVWPELPE